MKSWTTAEVKLTLREFRVFAEGGGQVDMFSPEGCGCFTDDESALELSA